MKYYILLGWIKHCLLHKKLQFRYVNKKKDT